MMKLQRRTQYAIQTLKEVLFDDPRERHCRARLSRQPGTLERGRRVRLASRANQNASNFRHQREGPRLALLAGAPMVPYTYKVLDGVRFGFLVKRQFVAACPARPSCWETEKLSEALSQGRRQHFQNPQSSSNARFARLVTQIGAHLLAPGGGRTIIAMSEARAVGQ